MGKTKDQQHQPKEILVETTPGAQAILANILGETQEIMKQRAVLDKNIQDLQSRLNVALAVFVEGRGYSMSIYNIVEYEDHGRHIKLQPREV